MDIKPFSFPFDTDTVQFWIASRAEKAGSISSIRTWISSLLWIGDTCKDPSKWRDTPIFRNFTESLQKQFEQPSDPRLPFKLKHIKTYTISLLETYPDYESIPLNILLKIAISQLYFFTASRPCELIYTPSNKTKQGLKIRHCKFKQTDSINDNYYHLKIVSYKNQRYKRVHKNLYVGNSRCDKTYCDCTKLNPAQWLRLYLKKRETISKQLAENGYSDLSRKLSTKIPNNILLVWKNGKPFITSDLREMVQEITTINEIEQPERYKSYSLRIGATTQAHLQKISHAKILKYIGWANSRLPSIEMRYIRYEIDQLKTMPFEMIHGPSDLKNNISFENIPYCFDPWDQELKWKATKRRR